MRDNLTQAAERIRGTSYPEAENFAAHGVLQPLTEREALELYAKVELR